MADAFDKLLYRVQLTSRQYHDEYAYDHHIWTWHIWRYFKR